MAMEPTTTRTRRAVLGAALGGAAAVAAQSLAPMAVHANTNDPMALGTAMTANLVTSVQNTVDAAVSLAGLHGATGTGVFGSSLDGTGLKGTATSTAKTDWTNPPPDQHGTGVMGISGDGVGAAKNTNETGVYGFGNNSVDSAGIWGDSVQAYGVYGSSLSGDGVYGLSVDGDGVSGSGFIGLYGEAGSAGGAGVHAFADHTETAVYAYAGPGIVPPPTPGTAVQAVAATTAETALQVSGKVKFSRSRRVAIGRTATSLKVALGGVTTSSYVLATLQSRVTGCYILGVVPASGYFTIYLSKAPGKTVYVGYMVIN
jgi:hypothetical protein